MWNYLFHTLVNTESQNGSCWKGPRCPHCPNPCRGQCCPPPAQAAIPAGLKHLQGWGCCFDMGLWHRSRVCRLPSTPMYTHCFPFPPPCHTSPNFSPSQYFSNWRMTLSTSPRWIKKANKVLRAPRTRLAAAKVTCMKIFIFIPHHHHAAPVSCLGELSHFRAVHF